MRRLAIWDGRFWIVSAADLEVLSTLASKSLFERRGTSWVLTLKGHRVRGGAERAAPLAIIAERANRAASVRCCSSACWWSRQRLCCFSPVRIRQVHANCSVLVWRDHAGAGPRSSEHNRVEGHFQSRQNGLQSQQEGRP